MEIDGVSPKLKTSNEEISLPVDQIGFEQNGVQIIVLSKDKALQLHNISGKIIFEKGTVYYDNGTVFCEKIDDNADLRKYITLSDREKIKLPYDYYLYSYGKRKYYSLRIDSSILDNCYDAELTFDFTGLNLQLFCGKTLIDDYFNTNGRYVIRLREFEEYIKSGKEFVIKTVPPTKFGVGNVYNEINLVPKANELKLLSVKKINLNTVK
ncbi:MAG: hypothetical protein PUE08_05105 [Eubacteriales bacterium]|nr:hypothetical protein [Eubacteriales bacterium]